MDRNDDEKEKNELNKRIGKRIRSIRLQKEIQAQIISAACDIEKSTYSRIEKGGTNPTLWTLLNISRALGISLEELVKDIDKPLKQ